MIKKETVEELVNNVLDGSRLFLIDIKIKNENVIKVIIDGDDGVTIQDCVNISRGIENNLDREKEDFELSVLSSGLEQPFSMLRQYKKYIGKPIKVIFHDDKIKKGILLEAENEYIILQEEIEIKHKKNKIKKTGEKLRITMDEIKQAKAEINFN